MKKKTKLIIALVLIILGAYFAYNYMYQDHRDINNEDAVVNISASELIVFFNDNKSEEVLNKTVQITGTITEIENNNITIDNTVQCSFDTAIQNLNLKDIITVKGRCIGYDELFEVAKMDQSSIIK